MVEYAIYQGDTFWMIGTADECAEKMGVKPESIKWMASPTGQKRAAAKKDQGKALMAFRLEDD